MAIINVRDRKLGADDVAWGLGSYTYTDANGVTRTTPEINAGVIPVTADTFISQYLLDVIVVSNVSELTQALLTLGSSYGTIYFKRGTYVQTVPLTIPTNVRSWFENGAVLNANNVLVTIAGPIEAGPYQIFSWTGTGSFDLSGSPTARFMLDWWGAVRDTAATIATSTNDNGPVWQKAVDSITGGQTLFVNKGIYQVLTPVAWQSTAVSTLIGEVWEGADRDSTFIYVNVGGSNDGFTVGNTVNSFTAPINGMKIRNMTFCGPDDCARYFLNITDWHFGSGMEKMNLWGGVTGNLAKIYNCENVNWDIWMCNQPIYYTGLVAAGNAVPAAGLLFDHGDGHIRAWLKASGQYMGPTVYVDSCSDFTMEEGIIENGIIASISNTENPSRDRGKAAFSTTTTKIAQAFTLSGATDISEVTVSMGNIGVPTAPVTINLYNTSGGVPNAKIAALTPVFSPRYFFNAGVLGDTTRGLFYTGRVRTGSITLAAGQYAVVVECTPADNASVPWIQSTNTAYAGGYGYYYDGSWHQATYTLSFAINHEFAVTFDNCSHSSIKNCHFENNNGDILINNSYQMQVGSIDSQHIELRNSRAVELSSSMLHRLAIDPLSQVILKDVGVYESLEDYGNTTYLGSIYHSTSGVTGYEFSLPTNTKGNGGGANYFPNTSLTRWETDRPYGGWSFSDANSTWTEETSIVHQATSSAKVVTSGAAAGTIWTPYAKLVKTVAGSWITWSGWVNIPSGNFTAQAFLASLYSIVPAWVGATDYNVGDVVLVNGTDRIVCMQAGRSGAVEPDPPAHQGEWVADGTNLLGCAWSFFGQTSADTVNQADNSIVGRGWYRFSVRDYIPANATGFGLQIITYLESDSSDGTLYLAEPSLAIGGLPLSGYVPSTPIGYTMNGKNRQDYDVKIPTDAASIIFGLYSLVGDVVWNTAASGGTPSYWQCTTAGINGTGAVWTAHNL